MKRQHLVISALGPDRPGIVEQLTEMANGAGCNVQDSRMMSLGSEFAIIMLLEGPWDSIARIETNLSSAENRLGLKILVKRTEPQNFYNNLVPYSINVVAMDNPGITYKVCNFFSQRDINIRELYTDSYSASHTGTPMFSLNLTVLLPATQGISELREQFMLFCDDLNLDAMVEPATKG